MTNQVEFDDDDIGALIVHYRAAMARNRMGDRQRTATAERAAYWQSVWDQLHPQRKPSRTPPRHNATRTTPPPGPTLEFASRQARRVEPRRRVKDKAAPSVADSLEAVRDAARQRFKRSLIKAGVPIPPDFDDD